MIVQRMLEILHDVQGVLGSFVVAREGELLVRSMPEQFERAELELTASRVARVLQCSSANGVAPQDGVFDFGEGKLWVREFVRGYLCVLCSAGVDMKSLRLTARLVARGLPAQL
ncbi:MAG TPA: hypothetical protein VFS67_19455 [Polyangiaceae bacterium]|jgi:hypothetical protein|nr:hypothetical protein [Polyangiaceae bacterium]